MVVAKLLRGIVLMAAVSGCVDAADSDPDGLDEEGDDPIATPEDVSQTISAIGCKSVSTTADLVHQLNVGACVNLEPGTYVIDGQLPLHPGQVLRGVGAQAPQIVIKASSSFPRGGAFGLVRALGSTVNNPGTIENVTLDGANVAYLGVQGTNARVLHSQIFHTRCNGVSILGGNSFEVAYSVIRYNGGGCPTAPPGAGIYVHGGAQISIHDNYIQNNTGPAIDINRVSTGYSKKIYRNTIGGNSGWAAISLFDTRSWSISNNTVSHPKTSEVQPYNPACAVMPNGVARSAAILLCNQDMGDGVSTPTVGNYVAHNRFIGAIGILLTGAGSNVPLDNSIYANDVFGSTLGCADASAASQASANRYNGVTNTSRQCYGGNVTRF